MMRALLARALLRWWPGLVHECRRIEGEARLRHMAAVFAPDMGMTAAALFHELGGGRSN